MSMGNELVNLIFDKLNSDKRNINEIIGDIKSLVDLDKVSNEHNDKLNNNLTSQQRSLSHKANQNKFQLDTAYPYTELNNAEEICFDKCSMDNNTGVFCPNNSPPDNDLFLEYNHPFDRDDIECQKAQAEFDKDQLLEDWKKKMDKAQEIPDNDGLISLKLLLNEANRYHSNEKQNKLNNPRQWKYISSKMMADYGINGYDSTNINLGCMKLFNLDHISWFYQNHEINRRKQIKQMERQHSILCKLEEQINKGNKSLFLINSMCKDA